MQCATVEGRMLQVKSTLEERMSKECSNRLWKRHLPSHHSLKTKALINLLRNQKQDRQARLEMNSIPKTSRFLQIDLPYVLKIGTWSP